MTHSGLPIGTGKEKTYRLQLCYDAAGIRRAFGNRMSFSESKSVSGKLIGSIESIFQ
jgi:hypothetical protein